MEEELESRSSESSVSTWERPRRWLERPIEGSGTLGASVASGLLEAVGPSRIKVWSDDSWDLGRFRLSKALSRSSILAISLRALILVLSSFSSCGVRVLPSFWSLAKSAAVLTSRLPSEAVVLALSLGATWSTIL